MKPEYNKGTAKRLSLVKTLTREAKCLTLPAYDQGMSSVNKNKGGRL